MFELVSPLLKPGNRILDFLTVLGVAFRVTAAPLHAAVPIGR
jgi:hypothetical protein